jgi:hypothetical protein
MITNNGQIQLLKQVSGKAPRFASIFVVGISDATLTTAATSLDFNWGSCNIVGSYVDEALQQVVFYGTLPADLAGDIKEVGLVALNDDFIKTGLPNAVVFTFDANEAWFSDGAFTISNNSTIGSGNYRLEDVIVGQYLSKLVDNVNVSRYDTLKLKLDSTNVSAITVTLKNDDLNYAAKDITIANGENRLTTDISTFTKTGTFNPQQVTQVVLTIKTVTNADNVIEFDALTLSSQANGGLVAREVLATTIYKRPGASMEIEFAVALGG